MKSIIGNHKTLGTLATRCLSLLEDNGYHFEIEMDGTHMLYRGKEMLDADAYDALPFDIKNSVDVAPGS